MRPITVSVRVERPREAVFAFLDDLGNHEAFTDHMLVDWTLSGPRTGAGARARMRAPLPGPKDWLELEVLESEARRPARSRRPWARAAAGAPAAPTRSTRCRAARRWSASSSRSCRCRSTSACSRRCSAAGCSAATRRRWSGSPRRWRRIGPRCATRRQDTAAHFGHRVRRPGPTMQAMRDEATFRVKAGLAEMLKGGVIMDVVDAEQAKIAEDAGAAAVMALERVPADIRRDGGVARMSDPLLIKGIQEAVTIPVMAKARIGHFAEAQVLEALEVDYIDESEVLTPADEANHIDKWGFKVPFVCGATNLGEALRRIGEGAAMIRSKGEAGTGDIVEAVRHMRRIRGEIRRLQTLDDMELATAAKELQAPLDLVRGVARGRQAAGRAVLRGRHRHAGRRVADDAARRRGRVRRLGHLQVRGPGARAPRRSSRRPRTSRTRSASPAPPRASARR